MINLSQLTTSQLHRIIAIKEQIESLQSQIDSIAGGGGETPAPSAPVKKGGMSAAGRARISAAAKARWARVKAKKSEVAPKKRRKMSAAAKAKIAEAARTRWAKARAAGKSRL
jgi:hypothetical protein